MSANQSCVILGNCLLINNIARVLAGAVFANNSQVTWDTCSLINNTAGRYRGAVSAHYNCQAKQIVT